MKSEDLKGRRYLAFLLAGSLTLALPLSVMAQKQNITPEEKKELIKMAKEELDGTTWELSLKEIGKDPGKAKRKKDTLYFEDRMIRSEEMEGEGFNPTNYTIRLKGKDYEKVIWETMQTSEDQGVAFWRGELNKGSESMRGVVSWHINDNKKIDYSFNAKMLAAIKPEPIVEETPTVTEDAGDRIEASTEAATPIMEKAKKAVNEESMPQQTKEVMEPVAAKVKEKKKEESKKEGWGFWNR